jgi:hypothetical protein
MAADHSARGSMKTGVKPETVCELQDTNDHRQVERKWRLPISVGKLSALEGRLINLRYLAYCSRGRFVMSNSRARTGHTLTHRSRTLDTIWRRLKCQILASSHRYAHSVLLASMPCFNALGSDVIVLYCESILISHSTSGVLDHALNLSISLSAGKETKWDSHSNGE